MEPIRWPRGCLASTESSVSATLSQLSCLGVKWISIRHLANEVYPAAERIVLVMDSGGVPASGPYGSGLREQRGRAARSLDDRRRCASDAAFPRRRMTDGAAERDTIVTAGHEGPARRQRRGPLLNARGTRIGGGEGPTKNAMTGASVWRAPIADWE